MVATYEPTTTIYAVHQMLLCMTAGERTDLYKMQELLGQAHTIQATSAALAHLSNDGMLKVVAKVSRNYIYERTEKPHYSKKFMTNKMYVSGFKKPVAPGSRKHKQIADRLLTEVELHDRRYITSIGW